MNTSEYVGDAGSGFFNQTGGTNTVSGSGNNLYIGYNSGLAGLDAVYGTYTLSAGTLSVSTGTEYVGYESNPTFSTGVFNQSGGTNTAGTLVLYLGSTYALIGGVLSCNTSEYLYGWGGINQTGGTNNVANTLYIGSGSYEPIYNLGGTGSLSSVDEIIGYGTGSMIQTGGTNTVTGNLRIGAVAGYVGAYTLSAGQASINSMFVGTGTGGVGVMTVSGTGVLDVGGVLKVYKNGNRNIPASIWRNNQCCRAGPRRHSVAIGLDQWQVEYNSERHLGFSGCRYHHFSRLRFGACVKQQSDTDGHRQRNTRRRRPVLPHTRCGRHSHRNGRPHDQSERYPLY